MLLWEGREAYIEQRSKWLLPVWPSAFLLAPVGTVALNFQKQAITSPPWPLEATLLGTVLCLGFQDGKEGFTAFQSP